MQGTGRISCVTKGSFCKGGLVMLSSPYQTPTIYQLKDSNNFYLYDFPAVSTTNLTRDKDKQLRNTKSKHLVSET